MICQKHHHCCCVSLWRGRNNRINLYKIVVNVGCIALTCITGFIASICCRGNQVCGIRSHQHTEQKRSNNTDEIWWVWPRTMLMQKPAWIAGTTNDNGQNKHHCKCNETDYSDQWLNTLIPRTSHRLTESCRLIFPVPTIPAANFDY